MKQFYRFALPALILLICSGCGRWFTKDQVASMTDRLDVAAEAIRLSREDIATIDATTYENELKWMDSVADRDGWSQTDIVDSRTAIQKSEKQRQARFWQLDRSSKMIKSVRNALSGGGGTLPPVPDKGGDL